MSKVFIIGLVFIYSLTLSAQKGDEVEATNHRAIDEKVVELNRLGDSLLNALKFKDRLIADTSFIKLFSRTLRMPSAYTYNFDTLTFIKQLKSNDSKFRLFTWALAFPNSTYRYRGVMMLPSGEYNGECKLLPFNDAGESLDSASRHTGILQRNKWVGCLYYDIISHRVKDKTYYTLLGWDGYRAISHRRIIEVISFNESRDIDFGADIFLVGNKTMNRVVFEYNAEASMVLNYIPNLKVISFDHLVPPESTKDGTPPLFTYVPDGTYDYFQLKKGKWIFMDGEFFEKNKGKIIKEAGK